ncbi:MAG: DUF4382 domain-containing protein [Marinifilum sp.]|jgi:hypothetical protein|nr:DUF4382 domain-containing protein [Marinifilum sp.]
MKVLKPLSFLSLLIIATVFIQCSDDNITLTTPVKIRLTDAPGQFDKVNIDIQGIQIHSSANENEENGWQEMTLLKKGFYDLLQFNNGVDTLLVDQDMPSGTVSQMRLILGENNTVVVDGKEYDLDTPSAQTSGLKFQVHDDFLAGIEYKLWIDFDAARSIVKTGNAKFKLKPVIRTFNEATSGAITGIISPAEALPTIHAIIGNDTISTIAEDDGDFLIKGLEDGTYKLTIEPIEAYNKKEIENITVTLGNITDAGTISIDAVQK